MQEQQSIWIVAIVAVVAIVAMVVFVGRGPAQTAGERDPWMSEGNVAGMAYADDGSCISSTVECSYYRGSTLCSCETDRQQTCTFYPGKQGLKDCVSSLNAY